MPGNPQVRNVILAEDSIANTRGSAILRPGGVFAVDLAYLNDDSRSFRLSLSNQNA